jgi:hypothetical protein
MAQAIVLLEAGILAVCFGTVLTRRGYIAAHKRPYPSSRGRMHLGVALILVGFGCIVAGVIML